MGKKEKFEFRMDEMSGDHEIYKGVFETTMGIMSLITALYLLLIGNGIDPVAAVASFLSGLIPTSTQVITAVLEGGMEIVGFFGIQSMVYTAVLRHTETEWAKSNKEMLLQGKWLHIHDKDNVRIGVVDIEQNFTQLKVKAFNINPLSPSISNKGRTKWSYITCKLYPRELTGIEFFGSYAARKADGTINQGIHIFHTMDVSSETGIPMYLNGNFCDSFRVSEREVDDISDRKGEIHLFRMTPALEEIIYNCNGVDYVRLGSILKESGLEDEPFYQMLSRVVAKYTK